VAMRPLLTSLATALLVASCMGQALIAPTAIARVVAAQAGPTAENPAMGVFQQNGASVVNITSIAQTVAENYAIACLLGANSSVPTNEAAATIATYYLPNATQFSVGKITQFPNETSLAAVVEEEITQNAEIGYGSYFTMEHLRIEPISNESAAVWITWHNYPQSDRFDDFLALDLYGFRLNPNATNGHGGGWEYVVPDNAVFGFKRATAKS